MASGKSTPKDAQVVASILKDVGIIDYEPRVLNQVLEFAYRYITNVLDDAHLFSTHAKKKTIDIEDVRLAINLQTDRCFTTPPPRELLSEIARQKNSTPLPLIKTTAGPRLPPDRYSLTACNYRLKNASKKPRISLPTSRLNLTTLQASNPATKLNPALTLNSKTGTTLSVVTKVAASPTVTIVSRTPTNTTMPKSTPTPIIKFSDGNRSITPIGTPIGASTTPLMTTSSLPTPQIIMPTIGVKTEPVTDHGEKRKREDDDYDAV